MQAKVAKPVTGATDIRTGSLARTPQSGTMNWIRDNPSASASAKCPASTSTGPLLDLLRLRRGVGLALPMPLLLQSIRHFTRHVIFIVFRENGIRTEHIAALQHALGHDTLPLAEQIGQKALVLHLD